ncbi:unnamed protein product [Heterobilharzia americana]|nr:unnamed protein product [Heterobilharzia americana]
MVYILHGIVNFPHNNKSQIICPFPIINPSWSTNQTLNIQQINTNNSTNPCLVNYFNGITTTSTPQISHTVDPFILSEQLSRNSNIDLLQTTISPVWNREYYSNENNLPILLELPTNIKNETRSFDSDQSQQSNNSKTNQVPADTVTSTTRSLTEDDSFHIFVGDLAPEVQDETLFAAFSNFGTITECKIIKDMHTQKPKGYGFVAYASRQEAERAIRIMNGQIIGTRAIRTNWAVRKDPADQAKDHRPLNYLEVFNASSASNTTIYVGGITNELTEKLLQDSFKQFGEIKEIRIFKDKGFSFIKFDSHVAATQAIVTMHGKIVGDQACKCSWGKEPTFSNKQGLAKRLSSALFVPSINDDSNGILFRSPNSWPKSPNQNSNLILELPAKKSATEKLHQFNVNYLSSGDKTLTVTNSQQFPGRNIFHDTTKMNNTTVNPTGTNPLCPYTCWLAGNSSQDAAIPTLLLDNITRGSLSNQTLVPLVSSTDNNPLLLGLSNIDMTKGNFR